MKTKTLRLVAVVTLLFGVGAPLAAQPPAIIPDKSAPDLPPGAIARLGISRLPMGGPRAFAADGNSFVGLSGDGFIVRFDARTGNQVGEKILVPDAAQHPKLSADGRFLVFMLKQTEIQVIETATGRIIFRRLVPDLCFGAQLTADGMSVVVPNKKGNDSRFLAWDLATGTE
ncbi:MAG TPA: hypothetical protein VGZ47_10325, partial [Gemmataceae bacterium]|nr:hypothetical protein [Gemmataceae bacterium]